jgi:hypothetical protein
VLLSEFSKVRKELPARYVFLIADYLIKFRLKVLLLPGPFCRFIKAKLRRPPK